jgi:sarcosine oxidase
MDGTSGGDWHNPKLGRRVGAGRSEAVTESFEYVVLGGGVMGCAAAYHIARAGRDVLLVDQFEVGHNRGSSHGNSRIIRLSYDHPDYVRLAQSAYREWAELEAICGQQVITVCGGIDMAPPDDEGLRNCSESMDAVGVKYDRWDAAEIMRRYPQFRIPANFIGLFQQQSGIVNADLAVKTLYEAALKFGLKVSLNTRVETIEGTVLKTSSGTFTAKKLIVTPGAWAQPLLQTLGLELPLRVTKEQWAFFKPDDPSQFQPEKFPVFLFYGGTGSGGIGFYGFPIFGLPGVKAAFHESGAETTADGRDFDVDPKILQQLSDEMAQIVPGAGREVIHAGTCLYTITPDHHFIIDRLADNPNIVVGGGFSGHGFKFAVTVGRMLFELADHGATNEPTDLFTLSRLNRMNVGKC